MHDMLLANQLRRNDQFEIGGFLQKITDIAYEDKQIILTLVSLDRGRESVLRIGGQAPFLIHNRA